MRRRSPSAFTALPSALAALCLLCAACVATWPGRDAALVFSYEVVIDDPADERVRVTAVFDGLDGSADRLRFSFPRGKSFVKLAGPLLDEPVKATAGGEAVPIQRISPFTWEVRPGKARSVRLDYAVTLHHRGIDEVIEAKDQYEFPYLDEDHGMLTSWSLVLAPQDLVPGATRVRFSLPGGWDIIAPWPAAEPGLFEPESLRALTGDLIAVGGWSRHSVRVGRFEGTIAFAPGQAALERAAVDPIRKIIENELKLFGRPPEGKYLFIFGRPDSPGAGGSPKTNSMTLSVNPRLAARDLDYLDHLIAHEFHHTWSASLFDAPDELRWYNEGFTDYYAYLVIARLELTSWEAFAETLGDQMSRCAGNRRFGGISLVDAGGDIFFSDRDANQLIYSGGILAAAWLDRAIRARGEGKTLDDFMRRLNNDPRWKLGETAPGVDDFIAVLRCFVDGETALAAERLVREPYAFEPVDAFSKLGVAVMCEEAAPDMSLRANLDVVRVVDVDPAGVAARVGVRAGDRFVEVNGREVSDDRDVRFSWRRPAENRIRLKILRKGKVISINKPLPTVMRYEVAVEPWREHSLPAMK